MKGSMAMKTAHFYPLRGDSSDSEVTGQAYNCHLEKAFNIKGFQTLVTEVTVFSISLSGQKKVNIQVENKTVGIKISVVRERNQKNCHFCHRHKPLCCKGFRR